MLDHRCVELATNKDEETLKWKDCKKLEFILNLSEAYVNMIRTSETIYPFKNNNGLAWNKITRNDDNDFWWKSYNSVKHNGKIEEANLENVVQSLAALLY
jgi:hypothetical protein